MQRLVVLDFYRFVAAGAVVVYHVALRDQESRFFASVCKFDLFVDFFFILSGFVIAYAYAQSVDTASGIAKFLRRRFARIYPLHFLMLMIFVVVAVLSITLHHPINQQKYSTHLIPAQLLLMQSWSAAPVLQFNFPAWSISVEFAMYLLFPLLMLIHHRTGFIGLTAIVVVGFVAMEVLGIRSVIPLWDDNYSPLRALPTFTIGMLIALYMPTPAIENILVALPLGACALVAAIVLMVCEASDYLVIALFAGAVFLTAYGEMSSRDRIFDRPFVRMLGDCSYGIYMIHGFVVVAVVPMVWPSISSSSASLGCAIVTLLFVWALAIPTFYLFERPMRDWLSGRRPARDGAAASAAT